MALNALYVDFNSYFASVEQELCPELRGKAVGVIPVMAETTCCIAASYEAKAFALKQVLAYVTHVNYAVI